MKFKALDTESGEVVYFDCIPCPHCGKWITKNMHHNYCEFCGSKLDWRMDDEHKLDKR